MHQQPDLTSMAPGRQLIVFGHFFNFLLTGEDTGGRYFIYEDLVPPGGGPPPHTHPDEEVFYVVEGEFEFVLSELDKPFRLTAGSLVRVPSGAVHTFKNVGQAMGRTVSMLLPGDLEKYYRAIGLEVTEQGQIPDLSQTPDYANMDLHKAFALAPEHQIQFVMPADGSSQPDIS